MNTRNSFLAPEPNDYSIFDSLAHLCPLVHGKAVYMARGLLDALDHPWSDNECEFSINATGRKKEVPQNVTGIIIYPNPVKDYLVLEVGSQFELPGSIEIFNSLGVLMFQQSLESYQTEIKFKNLRFGVYFVRINIQGYEQIERIIVY